MEILWNVSYAVTRAPNREYSNTVPTEYEMNSAEIFYDEILDLFFSVQPVGIFSHAPLSLSPAILKLNLFSAAVTELSQQHVCGTDSKINFNLALWLRVIHTWAAVPFSMVFRFVLYVFPWKKRYFWMEKKTASAHAVSVEPLWIECVVTICGGHRKWNWNDGVVDGELFTILGMRARERNSG